MRRIIALPVALAAVATALGAGTAQASGPVNVPCSTKALTAAIAAAGPAGAADLSLARGCTYTLTSPLPSVQELSVDGNGATLERSRKPGTPAFTLLAASYSVSVTGLSLRNGGGDMEGGAIRSDYVYAGDSTLAANTAGTAARSTARPSPSTTPRSPATPPPGTAGPSTPAATSR